MAKINTVVVPTTPVFDPAQSDDERERQLINLSMDAAEARIRAGVATSAEICHFLKLGSQRAYESLMNFCMGNCITMEDTNGNRKLLKMRREQKIDNVSALMDAYIAWKANKDQFE